MPRRPAVAQVRINGATTSTPAASPSVQVRNTCPSSSAEITSPSRSDNGPNAALTTAATSAQATKREHVGDPIQPAAPAREAAQEQRGDHERDGVPERLREHRPERRRVVAEQQIADHDRGPQADAVEEQHGEAETGRRPQRRHRAVEVGQLEADATGAVVRERHERDRARVDDRSLMAPEERRVEAPTDRVGAGRFSADAARAHGVGASLIRGVGPGRTAKARGQLRPNTARGVPRRADRFWRGPPRAQGMSTAARVVSRASTPSVTHRHARRDGLDRPR